MWELVCYLDSLARDQLAHLCREGLDCWLGVLEPPFLFGNQASSQTLHNGVYTSVHRPGLGKQ